MTQGVKPIDKSGAIAAGGTAQTAMTANGGRIGFIFQNLSTGDLWVDFTGTAVQDKPSIRVGAGDTLQASNQQCPVTAMSVIGATLGQKFTLWEM
jgi:hypothetical protein